MFRILPRPYPLFSSTLLLQGERSSIRGEGVRVAFLVAFVVLSDLTDREAAVYSRHRTDPGTTE